MILRILRSLRGIKNSFCARSGILLARRASLVSRRIRGLTQTRTRLACACHPEDTRGDQCVILRILRSLREIRNRCPCETKQLTAREFKLFICVRTRHQDHHSLKSLTQSPLIFPQKETPNRRWLSLKICHRSLIPHQ